MACGADWLHARYIQQYVNNRERTILESGDCAAFYNYVNSQRVCREGVAPLVDVHGDLAVTAAQKAEALYSQFSSVFTMDDGNLPDFSQRSPPPPPPPPAYDITTGTVGERRVSSRWIRVPIELIGEIAWKNVHQIGSHRHMVSANAIMLRAIVPWTSNVVRQC